MKLNLFLQGNFFRNSEKNPIRIKIYFLIIIRLFISESSIFFLLHLTVITIRGGNLLEIGFWSIIVYIIIISDYYLILVLEIVFL